MYSLYTHCVPELTIVRIFQMYVIMKMPRPEKAKITIIHVANILCILKVGIHTIVTEVLLFRLQLSVVTVIVVTVLKLVKISDGWP